MLLSGTSYNQPQQFHFCLHHGTFQKEEVLPLRLKNSREYFPDRAKCLGILPSSSMMCAMWSMRERKKDTGVEGAGKGWDKKKRKETGISKKSEIVSNQQCLQQIHAEVSRISRALASSSAFRNHEWCPHYHCKEHLQANKHENGQVYRWKQELILI